MNETKQLLRDENIVPTAEVIADGLGETNRIYVMFLEELNKQSISLMEWRYYNDGKAWLSKGEYKWTTSRGTNKVMPLFWLSIWECFFKVSFVFSAKVKEALLNLPISQDTKELINNTKPNGDKAKFLSIIFDVTNESQLGDIYTLAQYRKENMQLRDSFYDSG